MDQGSADRAFVVEFGWRFGSGEELPPDQRTLEATRSGYQDERIPIERLLDSRGFLRGLSPVHQRRKVWEAWKRTHGLEYVQPNTAVPYVLELASVAALDQSEVVAATHPHLRGDDRATEAARLVDQLFETDSCTGRARLLPRLALTFDGLRTTSFRRQLVDVLGSHLIGMDDDPTCSYTGRHLTQGERVAATSALRLTCSPHALYYFEKFTEGQGRRFQYNPARGIGHFATSAVVREAVIRAVAGMLDDLERTTYLSSRTSTWKMREYATDVAKLFRRLMALNSHLAGTDHRRGIRRLPLPVEARKQPFPVRQLWSQLTRLDDRQLQRLENVLAELAGLDLGSQPEPTPFVSYVERTRQLVNVLRELDERAWQTLQRRLASPGWSWIRVMVPDLFDEQPLLRKLLEMPVPAEEEPQRSPSLWGRGQLAWLEQLRAAADALSLDSPDHSPNWRVWRVWRGESNDSKRLSPRRAIERVGQIASQCRGVADATGAFLDDVRRAGRGVPPGNRRRVEEAARRKVLDRGGPGLYYHVHARPATDPNRLLFELAVRLLASVAVRPPGTLPRFVRRTALGWLAELECNAERLVSEPPIVVEDEDSQLPEDELRRYILGVAKGLATPGSRASALPASTARQRPAPRVNGMP